MLEKREIYEFHDYCLDVRERLLLWNGVRLPLAEKPFEVLCVLVGSRGRLVEKDELLARVWGDTIVEENNLDKSISRLRKIFGTHGEERDLIETVRGHGYRFVAQLRNDNGPQAVNSAVGDPRVRTLAVLPFTNFGNDPENEYFCEGLAEELLSSLAKAGNLKVAARTSAFSFRGKQVPISDIARSLGVASILEGGLRKSGESLFVTVRLVDGASGYSIWSERYKRSVDDVFALQDEIAISVIDALKVKLHDNERDAVLRKHTANTDAYFLYLKGQYYRWRPGKEDFANSLKYFMQSVEADPNFALGYFGISTYYGYGAAWGMLPISPEMCWPMAEAAARKALEFDPSSPELRLSFAAFDLVNYRRWNKAGEQIAAVAADHPAFPEIHHLYSFYLLALGRFDQAIEEARWALALDPLSLQFSRFAGVCLYYARRYDEAIAQFLETLELEPNNPSVHEILGEVYMRTRRPANAMASWLRAARLNGDDETAEFILSNLDDADGVETVVKWTSRRTLEWIKAQSATGQYVPSVYFARQYILLGETENALIWLERACQERNVFPLLIGSDPFYDPLRDDQRFTTLLERIRRGE